jgi:hypothetical protein
MHKPHSPSFAGHSWADIDRNKPGLSTACNFAQTSQNAITIMQERDREIPIGRREIELAAKNGPDIDDMLHLSRTVNIEDTDFVVVYVT